MAYIVASGQAISNSPLNHSPTKQMYSFSKAERFPKVGNITSGVGFYNLPDVRSTRYTTLGKGNRSDFTSSSGKSPVFYNYQGEFYSKLRRAPRYSFGVGRENFKAFCRGANICDMSTPGPAKYKFLKPFGSEAFKYSMRGKYDLSKSTNVSTPGPGAYSDGITINPRGKFACSRYPNIAECSFGVNKRGRFLYDEHKSPGPADYEKKPLFGAIFDSRFRSNLPKTMTFRTKIIDSREGYPGPGEYVAPSEFGIYESIKLHKSQSAANI